MVSTNEDPLENVPEVQTITITDPYYTQIVDIIPSGDSMLDIDEIQTITISEGLVRQTVEIQYLCSFAKGSDDTQMIKVRAFQHHPTLGYLLANHRRQNARMQIIIGKVLEHVLILQN